MNKTERLLMVLAQTVQAGGGIHTAAELAYLMGEPMTPALTKFLADAVKKGVLRRVAHGLFESTLTPPNPATALYLIAKKLRNGVLSYLSLESQLSANGVISQILIDRITVVTKGRSGTFKTPYGVIEFTHTEQPLSRLAPHLQFDPDIKMYRATTVQAQTDLQHCRRNQHMLDESYA